MLLAACASIAGAHDLRASTRWFEGVIDEVPVIEPGTMPGSFKAHAINYYTVPVLWSTLEVYHDLKAQRVLINGLDNRHPPYQFLRTADAREFSPNALIYYLR